MKSLHYLASLAAVALCGLGPHPAMAQSFHLIHKVDVAVGVAGEYTTSITSQTNATHQATTDAPGFLLSFRDHPVSWAGIELSYQENRFDEKFVQPNQHAVNVPVYLHEATAGYLLQKKLGALRPFIAVGGGALYFDPEPVDARTQIRPTGMFNVGFDVPVSRHFSMRFQGRSLYYRAPNFNNPAIASSRWVASIEPAASYVLHW